MQGVNRRRGKLQKLSRCFFLLAVLLAAALAALPVAAATLGTDCIECHGDFASVHGDFNHVASPASGPVVLFEDNGHDDAGWVGERPYFDVFVDCGLCHASDLLAIHGNRCATCHPTPYGQLGAWDRGCSQGGCHPTYHGDSATTAHAAFEGSGTDCYLCHTQSWAVTQAQCLNCHAAYGPGDVTPPVTTSNALATYNGPATIVFSITDNGKVGVGTTFYRLYGPQATAPGEIAAGSHVYLTAPGEHTVEFWSVDQSGNTESSTNYARLSIIADTSAPTTTSDAKPTYYQGATINLYVAESGSQGVKATYYQLNGGAVQTGTQVRIPATSGRLTYTLSFWSEDWSGNVEAPNTVSFTVISGNATLRLTWGDSDVAGSPCGGDPEANASWKVGVVGSNKVVATGSAGCPNWSGVNDVTVPVSPTAYYVIVAWWDSYYGYDDQTSFASVNASTPGEVIRLSY